MGVSSAREGYGPRYSRKYDCVYIDGLVQDCSISSVLAVLHKQSLCLLCMEDELQTRGLVHVKLNVLYSVWKWNVIISWNKHCVSCGLPPGGRLNIKMSSYLYRKSHCGDKMTLQPSYLHNGISYTSKMASLYWIRAQETTTGPHWGLAHWGRDTMATLCRQHFQMHFLEWKYINFD